MPELLKVIILGIVEGITEFLPISSTGHLIIVADLIDFQGGLEGTFVIFIQIGAILAVLWFYRHDIWQQVRTVAGDRSVQRFWLNIVIAFLPAAVIGVLIHDWIKAMLFSPAVVAVSLAVGGVIFLLVERRDHSQGTGELYQVSARQALAIGLAQVVSLIPGASRSGASIIGGLLAGLDRRTATAFSFYLAIPTLGGATLYELASSLDQIQAEDALNLLVGTLVSFVVALLSIGWLLRYVSRHDFRLFGLYRIAAGLIVLGWWLA